MRRTTLVVLAVALVVAGGRTAAAQSTQAAEGAWTGNLGLAYLATSGNSDTQTFGLDFNLKRAPDPWGMELVAKANQASNSGVTTAERYFASARATRALSDRVQVFAGLSGERDTFAGFDLRTVVEVGAGYELLQGPTHTLTADAGLTYTDENDVVDELSSEYVGAAAGLTYGWKLSEGAELDAHLKLFEDFEDTSNWRLDSSVSVQSSLTSTLAIKLAYELRYRNEPIGDAVGTDTSTSVSLVVKL